MKKFLSSALTSIILLAAGICLILDPARVVNFACYIAGGVCIAIATIKFFSAFKKDTVAKESVPCIVLLALGVVLITLKGSIIGVFPLIVGICFLVHGLLKLHAAFMIKKINEAAFTKLLVSALIGIALAILIITLHGLAINVIFRLIGALLIYNSIENIFSTIVSKPANAEKSDKKKKPDIPAESEDAE